MTELTRITAGETTIIVRPAVADDLPALVALLAADQLGATRESVDDELHPGYRTAFDAIDADPAHLLVAGERADDGAIVATMQLSILPGLARRGATRMQIEAVRVDAALRGRGLGGAMLAWAVDEARRRGCALVQLTSDKRRGEAHRLYGRLGFVASHEGFKLRF